MTNSYFKQVPNFEYVNRTAGNKDISNYITVKNLFKRGKIRPDIFGNLSFFTKYKIIGDERPDNIAHKEYEDSSLDWVVLLSNNILNIQSEWPLPQSSFDEVMLEKYGTYEKLHSGIHHYETVEIKNSKGGVILPGGLETPNKWKTNGNFIQAINTKINQISGSESKVATVTMNNGIKNLTVGSEVFINNSQISRTDSCISVYNKKDEFDGGRVSVSNFSCLNSNKKIVKDEFSIVKIEKEI